MKPIYAAGITISVCAILAWLAGFDFDHRDIVGSGGAAFSVWLSFIAWILASFGDTK